MTPPAHPIAQVVANALDGRFPVADGSWRRALPWRAGVWGVLSFTGHCVVVVPDDFATHEQLVALGIDGLGGATQPGVILELAGPRGWIDSLDVLLARRAE